MSTRKTPISQYSILTWTTTTTTDRSPVQVKTNDMAHDRSDCWIAGSRRLNSILATRAWIGFDLDDTLHEFLRSSGIATHATLGLITLQYGIPPRKLRKCYARILRQTTANAFCEGKTSFDYRRERFTAVLAHFSLPEDSEYIQELMDFYEKTLLRELSLTRGAMELLSTLKEMGKKVVVITEGPQDAQERALRHLGIDIYIDFLATSNFFRVSKADGLFSRVLEHLNIAADNIMYISDSEQRDIQPALAAGIFAIHVAQWKPVNLDKLPPRISAPKDLLWIISREHRVSLP